MLVANAVDLLPTVDAVKKHVEGFQGKTQAGSRVSRGKGQCYLEESSPSGGGSLISAVPPWPC